MNSEDQIWVECKWFLEHFETSKSFKTELQLHNFNFQNNLEKLNTYFKELLSFSTLLGILSGTVGALLLLDVSVLIMDDSILVISSLRLMLANWEGSTIWKTDK